MDNALLEAQRSAERWQENSNPARCTEHREQAIMWALLSIAQSLADLTTAEFSANEAERD